ncbi:MAG TPA: MEDS domain-containing protein [Segeticoccus sp.]|uniref:MEDS domain-containing protein n=1 Tax=Segeticoccus sp. TaxID=2706531 RepID=UPI002D811309|nr:MEDS domain-containing protein [Segeticoccus sp.]HET8599764.1 MEDS domain-containing protein [Segeticoccus sp.]
MRLIGVVSSASGLVPRAHLYWGFRGREEFLARAAEFLHDGIVEGQYVEFVGQGSVEELTAQVRELPGGEAGLRTRQVGVCPVEQFFVMTEPGVVDAVASVQSRITAGKQAMAAGFSASRAVVDATSVVRTPRAREAFAQFEHLIDVEMSRLPISAMCAYDTRLVDHATLAHLAALHPVCCPGAGPLRLYADPGTDLAVAGEADGASAVLVTAALQTVLPLLPAPSLRIDASELQFADHRGLMLLDDALAGQGRTAVLQGTARTLSTLAQLLPLRALRVEGVAAR